MTGRKRRTKPKNLAVPKPAAAKPGQSVCPACGEPFRRFWELSRAMTGFHLCDDGVIRGTEENENGDIYGVAAECVGCDVLYRIKGAAQILDIPGASIEIVNGQDSDSTCRCNGRRRRRSSLPL